MNRKDIKFKSIQSFVLLLIINDFKLEGEDTNTSDFRSNSRLSKSNNADNESSDYRSNSRLKQTNNEETRRRRRTHNEDSNSKHKEYMSNKDEEVNCERRSSSRQTRKDKESTRNRSASRNSRLQRNDPVESQEPKKSPKSQQFMTNSDAFSALPPTPVKSLKISESDSDDDAEVQVRTEKSLKTTVEKINYDMDYFKPIKRCSTIDFLLTPAPPGKVVNCRVRKGQGIFFKAHS